MKKKKTAEPKPLMRFQKVTREGSEVVYEITKISADGTEADIAIPYTKFKLFRVQTSTLKPVS